MFGFGEKFFLARRDCWRMRPDARWIQAEIKDERARLELFAQGGIGQRPYRERDRGRIHHPVSGTRRDTRYFFLEPLGWGISTTT